MNLFGQFVGQIDVAPLARGMRRAGDPAADGVPLRETLTRHLAVEVDLGGGRSGMEGVDEGHDVEPGELGILELHIVGEGATGIGLGEQLPLVHLNDHKGNGLRVAGGRPPLKPGCLSTGNNSLGNQHNKETDKRIRLSGRGGNGEVLTTLDMLISQNCLLIHIG